MFIDRNAKTPFTEKLGTRKRRAANNDNGDTFARPRPAWVDAVQRGADRFCYSTLCLVAVLVVLNLYRLALS
jgi:hypothetical protein